MGNLFLFPHTTRISNIHFQHTFPNTLSHHFCDHPEIPTHFLNLCWNFQHKTYFSDALFHHTFSQTKKGTFAPFRLLNLLPTHSSHFLLYPLADTLQELFQHIHSIDGKLPHEIICFFQLRLQTLVLGFQHLILSLQTSMRCGIKSVKGLYTFAISLSTYHEVITLLY